jgi:hypothetical protein
MTVFRARRPRPGRGRVASRVAAAGLGATTAAVLLAGCGDLLAPADRVPTAVAFEESVVTVTEGEPVELRPYVVDQHGQRIDRLPVWTEFGWSSSNPSVFNPGPDFTAGGPGQAIATATVAELSGKATVRVNPSSLLAALPHAYLVQSVQRRDGSVPMVAGRPATLRVFATGDAVNFFQPDVEATFFLDGEEVGRRRFGLARGGSVPRVVDEAAFENTWAVDVPAQWVQPGLAFSVRLDPDGLLPLTNPSPVRFPAEGSRAVDVRVVPDLEIRFVPIHQNRLGTTGSITAGSAATWTRFLEDVFPIAGISRDVRAAYHTDAVTSRGQTDWEQLIQEIWALRVLDGDDRYYYGVLRRSGSYAGLGYVGFPVAIGWDEMGFASGDDIPRAYTVFAHEMGHNFGRWHAPACNPGSGLDANYPYFGGVAGVFGLHRTRGEITGRDMPDLMGYCNPMWVSDYTYEGVLDFRLELEEERRQWGLDEAAGPGLLVWGSVTDGHVTLEPAVAVERAATTPSGDGDLVVEGRAADGRLLFRQAATAMAFSHGPGNRRAFSTVVPLSGADQAAVHDIRVTGPGVREGVRRGRLARSPGTAQALAAGRAPSFSSVRRRPGSTELAWDAEAYPLVVVREAGTGTVVSLARRGRLVLPMDEEQLTFDVSDGVRTVRARPDRP